MQFEVRPLRALVGLGSTFLLHHGQKKRSPWSFSIDMVVKLVETQGPLSSWLSWGNLRSGFTVVRSGVREHCNLGVTKFN